MAEGFSLSLDIDVSKLNAAENKISNMVSLSSQLQQNMDKAINNLNTAPLTDVLSQLKSYFSTVGNTKITPNFDVSKATQLYEVMDKIVTTFTTLTKGNRPIEFFDTNKLYASNDILFKFEDNLKKINNDIVKLKEDWSKNNPLNGWTPPVNPRTGQYYKENSQAYQKALDDEYKYRLSKLIEQKAIEQQYADWSKKTQADKTAFIQKEIDKIIKAEEHQIKAAQREYKNTLTEMKKLMSSSDKLSRKNTDGSLTPQIDALEARFIELNAKREQLENQYGQHLVEVAKKANAEIVNIEANRILEKRRAEQKAQEEYNKTLSGANAYSRNAKTINEEKQAIEYLIIARNNLSKDTARYDQILAALNNRIQKHRISVEQLTTAEKNEKTLQPTIRNEYAQILKEIDKLTEAKQRLRKTDAYQRGESSALKAEGDLNLRLIDLANRRVQIEQNAQGLLDEVVRKHAAERAQIEISETEKAEAKKAEIARRRFQEQLEQNSKYGTISSSSANRLIGVTDKSANIAQEEAAIKKLISARKQLDKNDTNYASTLDALNAKIKEHEHNIKMATDASYREAEAKKRVNQANSTYSGAMNYSKNTKSINEQIKAIEYLKAARANLDKSTMSQDEYNRKVQNLTNEIKRQQTEVDRLTGKLKTLKEHKTKLMDTTGQLQRKLALLFSVSAIQGYINKLVSVRGEFEMQQRSLQVLLQNRGDANKLWQQTVDLAVRSPFRVNELVRYTRQLAAYRIETDKLHDTTKRLADVSSGLGVDMQRLILAFGQVRAANFLRGTELRQFTEAGVPMLDELAKHFTDLEGRAVSAGDVFERISKRMVGFKDVEAVFKRMTDEGGVFYRMQEEQSKTLKGMISNLHDSIDLMLNDIGRSNDGLLKGMVSAARTLVENWRALSLVISEVGVAFAGLQLIRLAKGFSIAAAGHAAFALSMKGSIALGAKLNIVLKKLWKTLAANPMYAIGAVFLTAVAAVNEYRKAINAANEQYDELSRSEIERLDNLEKLNSKTQEYNKIIQDSNSVDKDRNDALSKNKTILEEIKTKYPELYPLITQQKDGTVDLTRAIEEQNRILTENIALQQRAKGGFLHQDLTKNYQQAVEANGDLTAAIADFKVKSMDVRAELAQAFNDKLISEEDYKNFSKLLDNLRSSKDFSELGKNYRGLTKEFQANGKEVKEHVPILGALARSWAEVNNKARDYNTSLYDLGENFDRQASVLAWGIREAFYDANGGDAGSKAAGEYISSFLDEFNIVDKDIREWSKEAIIKRVDVDFNILFPDQKGSGKLDAWAERVKAAVQKVNDRIKASNPNVSDSMLFPLPDVGQTKEQYLNLAKSVLDIAKATYREGQKIVDDSDVQRTKLLKNEAKNIEAILNIEEKNITGQGKDWMSEMVTGIKEAHQEYVKLSKTLNATEAKQLTLSKYAKSFAESVKNAGLKDIKLGQFKFETEQGAIDALEFLKSKLPENAKQARFKIEEEIGEIRGEIRVRTEVEKDKALIDKIEDMFSGYELSLELQKLNIPPDLAKQLFNVDSIDLSSIRSKIEYDLAKARGIGGQEDLIKELEKQLEKVEDLENKAQQERLKKYTTYLLKAQSERVKIKLDEIRQLAEIEKLGFSETQKEQIKQTIQLETKQKLDKAGWDAFKETDLYVQMFEDLGVVSDKVLNDLKTRLTDIRGSLSDLSPRELKEVVSQLEKVTSEQISRNPFKNLGSTIKDGVKALKRLKKEQEEYANALKKQESIQKRVDNLQIINKQAESQIEAAKAILLSNDATEQQRTKAQHIITENEQIIKQNNILLELEIKKLAAQKGITDEAARRLIITRQEANEANKTLNSVGNYGTQAVNSIQQMTDMLENWGVEFGEEVDGTLNGLGQMFAALESIDLTKPMSIITGTISFIAGLGNTLASLFGFGNKDNKKEKQIKREIKYVEDLERAYEKLEKAIDDAYSIDTLKASGKAAKENIESQIASYEKMIAAEESKKKTDKDRIKEWQIAIEDLIEQKAEIDKQLISTATSGILDDVLSAASEFTDAWLEAFNETEDGLSGLEENFKSTMLEMVKQQAAMLISQSYVEKWKRQLEQYINPNDLELSTDEAKKWVDAVSSSLPQLNEALENYFTAMQQAGVDLSGGQSGELSGLQRGIQGVTEETAQIIEAYLNSVRFFVADSNSKLTMLVNQFVGNEESVNPMLSELRAQTEVVRAIRDMFSSVIKSGHPTYGGAFIKVAL